MLFRLIIIKYADYGLAQTGGLTSSLFNKLYILITASSSIQSCSVFVIKLWRQMDGNFSEEQFLLVKPQNSKILFSNPNYAIFLLYFFGSLMIFLHVQYLKKHKTGLKKEIQRNIVTFDKNFYFLFVFSVLTFISMLLKNVASAQPSGWIKSFIIFIEFIRVFFDGFLRPVIIMYLLEKNMPDFFEDREENLNTENTFFYSGQSFQPRKQMFSPYKPFSENARWGWQKQRPRPEEDNVSDSNVVHQRYHIAMNSMPEVDI